MRPRYYVCPKRFAYEPMAEEEDREEEALTNERTIEDSDRSEVETDSLS